MGVLKSNHWWQLAWWTTFIVSASALCDNIGNVDRTRGAQQIHTSSIYVDLNHPALCNGYITQIHFCYHVVNLGGFVGNNPMHEAVVQIWREKADTQELHLVSDYKLNQDTSQDNLDDFVCRNKTLSPKDYIAIHKNDVIGATLPIFTLMSPLQLISAKSSRFGLYFVPLSATSVTTLQKSSLTLNTNLMLHLYASIEPITTFNVSNINSIKTASSSISITRTSVMPAPTSRIITSGQVPMSPSKHITTVTRSYDIVLTASTVDSPLIPTTGLSLFTSVGATFSPHQPTLTFYERTFTTSVLDASQDVHMGSSYHHSSAIQTLSQHLPTQTPPTAPTALPQPTTKPITEVPPPHDPPPDTNSMSTIIAGLAALILLLATLAGCTIIGCLAYVYYKPKPSNIVSSEDKDEKDAFSLKDISPLSSLNKSMDSGIVMSSVNDHLIAELSTTTGSIPASLPIAMESENSSISASDGHTSHFPEVFVLPPNKKDGHSCSVVPPPPVLSVQELDQRSHGGDHDYKELTSRLTCINVEQNMNNQKKIIVPVVENCPSVRSHRRVFKNNSMPILDRKEECPSHHHEYDEPSKFRRKIPDYQNKSMIIVTQNKGRGRTHTVSGPLVRRVAPSSGTKDYEVPIMSSCHHETRQRANSAITRCHSCSPHGAKLNKAKSMRVETHGHRNQNNSMMNRGGCLNKEQLSAGARNGMPTCTGSSLLQQTMEEVDNQDTMDGPYCQPPSEEPKILALLKELNVENISLKSIIIPPRELFGRFGSQTVKTSWRKSHEVTIDVCLKATFTDEPRERLKLLQEAAILAQFRHPNVIRLQGIISNENVVMLVLEHFPNEDLTKFLIQMGRNIIPPDTPKLLLSFSQQVALGMQYLSSKGFVHKDLAARNVFVTSNDTCKVGALWKSKELSNIGDKDMLDKIFVKWTAPEAMYQQKYSIASDIWSYGCLLYEIWSLGRIPFKTLSNKEVIEKVDSGYRLPPPPGCPRSIYELMIQCWNPRPLSRPNFKDILNVLLRNEIQTLQIPVRDASTHDAAIILGAKLEASKYMYLELQHTYVATNILKTQNSTVSENGTASKQSRSDYDHIDVQNFFTTFPTSSADIECMFRGQSASSTNSFIQQHLYSKSPTGSGEFTVASPCHEQPPQDILDSDYEEIIDTR